MKTMKISTFVIIAFFCSQIICGQHKKIEVTHKIKNDNSIEFYYKKNIPGSYYLKLEFDNLTNCNDRRAYEKIIKHSAGSLFTLKPSNKNQGISFSYKFIYTAGNPNPKIDEDIVYLLPFKTEKSVKIFEASNVGEKYFGSKKPIDWKSFIVYSTKSDTIYAMRKGIVVAISDTYNNDATFKKVYTSERNSILIEHIDGSVSSYKGFDKNQIFVKLGQEVYPHSFLGKLEKFNTPNYRLDFSVFHYLKNLLDTEKSTLKDRDHKVQFLDPVFFIENANKKIKSRETYQVLCNENIKLQEFSRREKRKYRKEPKFFE
jgi:hypothetical protein